jgi:hypothetical protein
MASHHTPAQGAATRQIGTNQIRAALIQPASTDRIALLGSHTLRLDGRTRFNLCNPTQGGDLLVQPPQNHLWSLFANQTALAEVDAMIMAAFNRHLIIDPSMLGQFRIRLSERAQAADEVGWGRKSLEFYRSAPLVTEFGDGVQAFVGLTSAVMSLPQRVLLIDEPEAFLHPPLARMLGANLARTMHTRGGTLVVSTHSAEFVMGCVESRPDVSVVRLEYTGSVATARALEPAELASMMRNPVVRSTQALQGLFHRAVIVTEADGDRAFYSEINRRLAAGNRGLDDALFLNARGWQSIGQMLGPLRKLGIPTACIVDFDALSRPAGEWQGLIRALNLSAADLLAIRARRAAAERVINARAGAKASGLRGLTGGDRRVVSDFIDLVEKFGVFVVPNGALESWLQRLAVPGSKDIWVTAMLARLDRESVTAGQGDVWAFVSGVRAWATNPLRAGMGT